MKQKLPNFPAGKYNLRQVKGHLFESKYFFAKYICIAEEVKNV